MRPGTLHVPYSTLNLRHLKFVRVSKVRTTKYINIFSYLIMTSAQPSVLAIAFIEKIQQDWHRIQKSLGYAGV